MVTTLVQFKLPPSESRGDVRKIYTDSAPKYQTIPGLIRKYYLLSEELSTGGGVYLWKSLKDAERFFSDDWKKGITERYGAAPTILYFSTPLVVDNLSGEIIPES